jgi:hypothetical protein
MPLIIVVLSRLLIQTSGETSGKKKFWQEINESRRIANGETGFEN